MSAKPLPPGIPEPPEGFIYVGLGPIREPCGPLEGFASCLSSVWLAGEHVGHRHNIHYAVKPGTPAARACGVPDAPDPKPKKCLVHGCSNHSNQGGFVGDLCYPCHRYLTTGKIGYTDSFLGSLVPKPEREPEPDPEPATLSLAPAMAWARSRWPEKYGSMSDANLAVEFQVALAVHQERRGGGA